jgi:L-alanine-DL-glutamate epimerase-like enolase superfamily enzyme
MTSSALHIEFRRVDWPYKTTFRIASREITTAETVWVEATDGAHTARGEGMAIFYHGETIDSLLSQLAAVSGSFTDSVARAELESLLPPGGARNAVDCALWDLEAKRSGRRAWTLAGVERVRPLLTAYTLSVDSPETMGAAATAAARYSLLKLKLSGEGDVERVTAVRQARPDAELIVDANQSWNERQLREFVPALSRLGVKLIEQPLRAGADDALKGFESAVPLCADESCQTTESLPSLAGKYHYINIKLDKTGGLTEALRLARAAQAAGFKLMVGCMGGSSLAMAPAFIVGQLCSVVDLDGPLLAATDVACPIRFDGSYMQPPEVRLWG